jgi:hypothetical protein
MGRIFAKTHSSSVTVAVVQEEVLPIPSISPGQVDPIPALLQKDECIINKCISGLNYFLTDLGVSHQKKSRKPMVGASEFNASANQIFL